MRFAARILSLVVVGIACNSAAATDITDTGLFQNRFLEVSTDNQLSCSKSSSPASTSDEIDKIISFYETGRPGLQDLAVNALLADITHSTHLRYIEMSKLACKASFQGPLCVLASEWHSFEIAKRILAIFYDTGFIIGRDNPISLHNFSGDQVEAIEKAIRKIPPQLRRLMNQGQDSYFPITLNGATPVRILPMHGEEGNVGQVYNGSNSVFLNTSLLDLAKDGRAYKDLELRFDVDFRVQMIVHEFGHVVDGRLGYLLAPSPITLFQKGLSRFDSVKAMLSSGRPVIWPNRWWCAFGKLDVVQDCRYVGDGDDQTEKFAEFFAQYVLMPKTLSQSEPAIYDFFREKIFSGVQFSGYETCKTVEPLRWNDIWLRNLNPAN